MIPSRPARLALTLLFAASLLASARSALAGDAPKMRHRVLIVTGEDYPGHKWRETAPVLQAELAKDPRLAVEVLTDLTLLASVRLGEYDAVVLHFKNYDPKVPGRKAYGNLAKYVEGGGGLVLLHFACGAFEEFKADFVNLAGRVWFGINPPPGRRQHDPHGPFTVNIAKIDHPITKGMADFETVDELYTCLEGEREITVLATAVSKIDKKPYPIAMVHQYGKGRVFHSVLGHDVAALQAPGAAELHRRGCAWVCGVKGNK